MCNVATTSTKKDEIYLTADAPFSFFADAVLIVLVFGENILALQIVSNQTLHEGIKFGCTIFRIKAWPQGIKAWPQGIKAWPQ